MSRTDASSTIAQPPADVREWIIRRWFTPSGAAVAELHPGIDATVVFRRLARRRHCLFLDSAAVDAEATAGPRLGRHSFLAVDPIHSVHLAAGNDGGDAGRIAAALDTVRSLLADLACATIPGLPPFQGGVAGLVSYECGLARLGIAPAERPTDVPLLSLHVYDVVCGFDHDAGRGWIISQGVPARGPTARRARATERIDALLTALASTDETPSSPPPAPAAPAAGGHMRADLHIPGLGDIASTQTRSTYLDMVRTCIELVRAGDIFQANLAQELSLTAAIDPVDLHLRCRSINPAPFAAFFAAGPTAVVSTSPERLLQVERGIVRMHPIKGTRRVLSIPEADLYAGEDLGASEKDRAENVMIVDLVRNDLSRVCTPQSVRVEALCRLERYRYVQHLVSIVSGRLRPGCTPLDALDAAIPGGSVTGAPKHRACEIIESLEGFRRGAYCGSLGYLGLDGTADFNLLIRTFVAAAGSIRCAVGGGITARSEPAAEYAETLHKAEGMLRVLASYGAAPSVEAPP